jgi:hypothetical protein
MRFRWSFDWVMSATPIDVPVRRSVGFNRFRVPIKFAKSLKIWLFSVQQG